MDVSNNSQKVAVAAAIVFMIFGSYVLYALFLMGPPAGVTLAPQTFAKDGEDDGDGGDEEDSNDSDEDDGDDNSGSGSDKSEKEKAKKETERQREAAKKAAEREREMNRRSGAASTTATPTQVDDGDMDNDGNDEDGDVSEDGEDGMFKDRAKTLERINKKIAQAEEKIMKKQAEGVDVSAALAALDQAKAKAGSVDALFAAKSLDQVKDLTKETERLAHDARGTVLHSAEKSAKNMAKVDKRIAQTKKKIAEYVSAGGDGDMFTEKLSAIEAEWAGVKEQITAGGDGALTGLATVETMERRVKTIKNAVENALLAMGISDDTELEDEHVAEVGDDVNDLKDLAEIETEDEDTEHDANAKTIKRLATAHQTEATKAAALIERYGTRGNFARQMIGDDRDSLRALQDVVTANESRIVAMEREVEDMGDTGTAVSMRDSVRDLREQNAKLQNFINTQPITSGIFGWLFNWF